MSGTFPPDDPPNATTDALHPSWTGLLDPSERILWQGQPVPKLRLEFRTAFEPFFAVFLIGFAVFWMVGSARTNNAFSAFGVLILFVGFYQLLGQHFWKYIQRRRSFYTLTDRRAFIATDVLGRRNLKSYPVNRDSVINLRDGNPGSIYFATEVSKDSDGNTTSKEIGFELVEDCRSVYSLFREIQRAQ